MSIFYKSVRIGKNGKPFILYKFKTMIDAPGPVSTSADDPRITKIGRFLRRYKIDELPQLLNILKGDMVFVGPRPEVPEVINMLTDDERAIILSVKPGLTDLATLWDSHEEEMLKGEPDPHKAYLEKIWPEKKRLQIEYIKSKSLLLDLKILTKTTWRIIKKQQSKQDWLY